MKQYVWNILISIDQFINALLGPVLNIALGTSTDKFGDPDETLSSVLGKNVRDGQCFLCKVACAVIEKFSPGHCIKSIEGDEGTN